MSKYHRSSKYQRATTFRDLTNPKPMFGGVEIRKAPIFENRGYHFFVAENGKLERVQAMKNRVSHWQITLTIDGKLVVRELVSSDMIYVCEKDVSGMRLEDCHLGKFDRVQHETNDGDASSSAA